ncbi:MAG: type II toxin-antitoxin system HicB family antitoxin [Treponema sp.]|nr:type II toxin-antitoxin system HicB family antitoxin [Treponema sp.]
MKYVYPAIFENDDGKIAVSVPDVKGCYTFGDDMADAIFMAQDALSMMLVYYEDNGVEIPKASGIDDIKTDGAVSYVVADTAAWRKENDSKAVKKTLSIPSWLNKKAELASINFSQTLQEALCLKLGIEM